MSAVLCDSLRFRPMSVEDLDAVIEIENDIYPFPWTRGNFSDSLHAGYSCWVAEQSGVVVGYLIMMIAVGEAHVLNVGVARAWQGQGIGRGAMTHAIDCARQHRAEIMFLEVRPSNQAARRLYESMGFNEMAIRKNYYPAPKGREDAILMGMDL